MHLTTVSLAVIAGGVVIPFISSKAINALNSYLKTEGSEFWPVFGGYIIAFIAVSAFGWISWRCSGLAYLKFEISTTKDLYRKVFKHLMSMSYRFFTDTFGGSLVAQTNRFVKGFENLYDVISFDLLILVIRYIVAIAITVQIAPTVAIGLLIWSVLFVSSAIFLSVKKLPLSKRSASRQSETTGRLSDNLTNISNIKYFAKEKLEIKGFKEVTSRLAKAQMWDWGVQEILFAWQAFLAIIFEIIVFWLSLKLVASGQIDLGQLVLIQLYINNVVNSLWNVPKIVRRFESTFADAAEMSEILFIQPEVKDAAITFEPKIKAGAIKFEKVSFYHHDSNQNDPLFKDLDLRISAHEKIGLAGPSGGGKTTLTKLLLRLADINSGRILIDGQDISKLKQSDLRSFITYVPQEPILFHRSLLENIAYGKPDATEQEIFEAAKRAHADEFISRLSDGYNTLVGERGVKLSGGQRQRIAIARAILKDAPILVFDEATSALDSESEKLIQDAVWDLMQNRTAIVVAHRLSTIQKLDRIVVMDKGDIAEEGSHSELMDQKGLYAKLWAHQTGSFLEEPENSEPAALVLE